MASESVFDGLITAEWQSNASLLMLAEDLATYPDLAEFRRVADSLRERMEVPESEWPASWPAGTHIRRAGCEVRCLHELARTLEKRLSLDAVAAQLARVRATVAAMAAVEEHVPKRQRGAGRCWMMIASRSSSARTSTRQSGRASTARVLRIMPCKMIRYLNNFSRHSFIHFHFHSFIHSWKSV